MANNPDKATGLLTAFVSATATAYALAYVAHAEWGLRRVVIREEAMGLAALLAIAIIAGMVFQRNRNKGS